MKLAYIGTYPPRECGIGTFTMNLYKSMVINTGINMDSIDGFIVAMNDHDQTYDYPEEVKLTIRQEHQRDYLLAVKFINLSGADLCILEHEFGIFGGQDGVYILPLLHRLEIPLIVTIHTIIKAPSYNEKAILVEICRMANKIVIMSYKAIEFLTSIYNVEREKIVFIDHLGYLMPKMKQYENISNNFATYLSGICRELKEIAIKNKIANKDKIEKIKT